MELRILSPQEDGFLKEISFNDAEIKQELAVRLEKYKGLVYSEEDIKIGKADRATLNKFKEAIEDKRKEVKKQCLAPYEAFEAKIKEILAMVEEPINAIDKQAKAYETKQEKEKKEVITGVYEESIGDLKELLPLDRLWNEKWLNTTYKLPKISEEIVNKIEQVKKDFDVIEKLGTEFELQVKDKYLKTLFLSDALAENIKLTEQKAKLDEYKKVQEEKALAKLQEVKAMVTNPVKRMDIPSTASSIEVEPLKGQVSVETVLETKPQEVQLEELVFRVWVTPEQKKLLKELIISQKIKCGKV